MDKFKNKLTMSHIFVLIMVVIISASMIFSLLIMYTLIHFNFSILEGMLTSTSFIAVMSVALGIAISSYVSRKILRPILKINDAAKKVAMGDYSVRLEEKSIAVEIWQIARNFNIMVRELSKTETLANDFVSNVSHEFKTPLSAIEGYATLLQDDTSPVEEKQQYINYILENTARLSQLTHSILSLSRLENQEIVIQKRYFSLDEQLRRILLEYENKWEEKKLIIDLNLEKVMFYGNQSLLAQVWSNLIDNAIKFSRQGGVLSINCFVRENNITVIVKDNGIGMDKEVQKHAFDKFYQGEHSHTQKGNGLGLALVKRIVMLCGGTIFLVSQKGIGSSFTVQFPNSK